MSGRRLPSSPAAQLGSWAGQARGEADQEQRREIARRSGGLKMRVDHVDFFALQVGEENRHEARMPPPELLPTQTLRESWEVDPRLAELELTRKGLLQVAAVATDAAATATPHHCANAAGTFAYQHGSWALRDEFVGPKWKLDRPNNVEAIWNENRKVRVIYTNVDIACDDDQKPQPRSDKGAGAERVCSGNLFGRLPSYYSKQYAGESTYYLMVDESGRAELTRVVISGGTFSQFVERIYLIDDEDLEGDRLSFAAYDAVSDFDPVVTRKSA